MRPPVLGALCALLVSLFIATPAHAVPDGPLDVYLEHLEPLSLQWPRPRATSLIRDGA